MARKSPADLRAAKEKKQKKIAAIGGVLLVILMIVQVPRTMKMLDDGAAAAPPAATPTTPAATTGTAAVEPSTLTPPTLQGANPTAPATAGASTGGEAAAQLVSFSRFESKDPFAQQIKPKAEPAEQANAAAAEEKAAAGTRKAGASGGGTAGSGGSAGAEAHASAHIAVNGVEEVVALDKAFPAATPLFVLVSVEARSAKIKVADGGSFAAGDATLTLELKQPVTLVNTADGTRFALELRSVP